MSDVTERGATGLFDGLVAGAPPEPPPQRSRRRRRWLYVLAGFVAVAAVLAAGAKIAVRQAVAGYDRNIQRFGDPFGAIPTTQRPARAATGDLNVLLLGSDSRISAGDPRQWTYGAQRTDAIMVVHLQADRKGAFVISIPRDSWVPIPGHGTAKINAAFSWGGPSLMVQTVERVTGVHIDHLVVADFTGFKELTDDLGGVDITIPQATHDERAVWTPGVHHMDGATALNYVRQRHNLPGGDFDRVKRQQNWIRAVVRKLVASGTITNPISLNRDLTTLSKAVSTDSGFGMDQIGSLVSSLSDMDPGELRFLTTPTAGTGWSPDGQQSIVKLDAGAGSRLWLAVQRDSVRAWMLKYRPDMLPEVVH